MHNFRIMKVAISNYEERGNISLDIIQAVKFNSTFVMMESAPPKSLET